MTAGSLQHPLAATPSPNQAVVDSMSHGATRETEEGPTAREAAPRRPGGGITLNENNKRKFMERSDSEGHNYVPAVKTQLQWIRAEQMSHILDLCRKLLTSTDSGDDLGEAVDQILRIVDSIIYIHDFIKTFPLLCKHLDLRPSDPDAKTVVSALIHLIEDPSEAVRLMFCQYVKYLIVAWEAEDGPLKEILVSRLKDAYTNAKATKNTDLKNTLIRTTGEIGSAAKGDLVPFALLHLLHCLLSKSTSVSVTAYTEIRALASAKQLKLQLFFSQNKKSICQFLIESLHSRHLTALSNTPRHSQERLQQEVAHQREVALDILSQVAHVFEFPDLNRFLNNETEIELGSLLRQDFQGLHNELLLRLGEHYQQVFNGLAILASFASSDDPYQGPREITTPELMEKLIQYAMDSETVEPIISQMVTILLKGCQDTNSESGVEDASFAKDLLTELTRAFLAYADDVRAQDSAAYAMQELLAIYECREGRSDCPGRRLWRQFPEQVQEILEPHLNSRYKSSQKALNWDKIKKPIYLSDLGRSFATWSATWAGYLITKVYAEIMAVLNEDSHRMVRLQDGASDLIQLSTQTVFSMYDHLTQWSRHTLQTLNTEKSKERPNRDREQKKLNMEVSDYKKVIQFLDLIPQDILARASFRTKAYTRAVMHFESFIFEKKQNIQDHLSFLQSLYAAMHEPDGVSGVNAIRKEEPSLREQILEHESSGLLRDATACYDRAIQLEPDQIAHYHGLMKSMLGLGQLSTVITQVNGVLANRPQWKSELNTYRVEAAWKLTQWDLVEEYVVSDDNSNTWSVQLGHMLLAAKKRDAETFYEKLKVVRTEQVVPLSAASYEWGSYQRGYEYIVRLHKLCELEHVFWELQKEGAREMELTQTLKWQARLEMTQNSFRAKEPILALRRALLSLAKKTDNEDLIGECWLQSARVARKAGIHQTAYNALLNAGNSRLSELYGDVHQALIVLQKGVQQCFPDDKEPSDMKSIQIKGRAMLLVGRFMEETANFESNAIMKAYKDVTNLLPEWEDGNFYLAKYYDKLMPMVTENKMEKQGDLIRYIVLFFGKSLQFGNQYIYQSMPRMLTLWLDFGAKVYEWEKAGRSDRLQMKADLGKINRVISEHTNHLAPYQFLTAFSQLISRICHSHDEVFTVLMEIIAKVFLAYPQQAMWMMTAVSKSSYPTRVSRCKEILRKAADLKNSLEKFIGDANRLTDKLLELCNKQVDSSSTTLSMSIHFKQLKKLVEEPAFSQILIPLQSVMTPTLPSTAGTHTNHDPFPGHWAYISGFDDTIEILASLQKPKKICLKGSDGKLYTMMCKPKDDLRKDCRLMEFNSLINKSLRKDAESRRRELHIRTYAVLPLNEECGIIEWVNNTSGLRQIVNKLYKEKGCYMTGKELRQCMLPKSAQLQEKLNIFKEVLLPRHPPVFHEWFLRTFLDPASWYSSRSAYCRSTAVMSMVGYILGLGDRHGENILFDSSTGECIHVDFNCLFNKGETFDVPEVVPFRLTHNMVHAMGPMGTEGLFRQACEVTLRLMRDQREPLMSVLKTFLHDPLVEWSKPLKGNLKSLVNESGEIVNEKIPEFDNLYLDMNGIIHQCSHPNDEDVHFRISEEKIFTDIFHYLEVLFRIIKPRKVFFMAVDGVAPRAKMNQQRGRRFRSAKEAEEKIKKAVEKGETLPTEARFDSNCITPGTEFMARLHEQLKYFVNNKITTDKSWQGVKVFLSGHEKTIPFDYDLERIIDDWILMGFLVGNDFIPHLPHLHINHDALPLLYRTYISVLPKLGGYINENGNLNLNHFEKYLEKLSEFDREHFSEVFVDLKWFESKVGNKYLNEAAGMAAEEARNHKGKRLKKQEDVLCLAAFDGNKEPADVPTKELPDDENDEDLFETEFRQYKRTYYMTKMGVEVVSEYYPYHYAPYLSDIHGNSTIKLEFTMGNPFMPFEQLLAVLPAAIVTFLFLLIFKNLMTSENSPIFDYYPLEFKTDLNGKQQEWEAVVLIPFIDETSEDVASLVLGKSVFVNWPHLEEARVVAVSDGETNYHKRKGIIINETAVLLFAQLLTGRKYVLTSKGDVVLEKQWSKQILPFAYQATVNVQDSADVVKEGRIRVLFTVPCEPQLEALMQNQHKYSVKYSPGYVLASRLGISPYLVSRFSGSIFVARGSKKNQHGEQKANIGLNLKFNKKNEEVPGYTKKSGNEWLYSVAVEELLAEYLERAEKVEEIITWLKTNPVSSCSRASCDLQVLDAAIILKIEEEVEKCKVCAIIFQQPPLEQQYGVIPDKDADYRLFDRVVNVRDCFTVPLGFRGTVTGIKGADRESEILYEVVFDEEFPGGLTIRCSPGRGYRLSPSALINLSHGYRLEYGGQRLTAIVKPQQQPAAAYFSTQKVQIGGLNHSPRSPFVPTKDKDDEYSSVWHSLQMSGNPTSSLPLWEDSSSKHGSGGGYQTQNTMKTQQRLKHEHSVAQGYSKKYTDDDKGHYIESSQQTGRAQTKQNPCVSEKPTIRLLKKSEDVSDISTSQTPGSDQISAGKVSSEFQDLMASVKISNASDSPSTQFKDESSKEPLSPQSFAMQGTLVLKEMLKIEGSSSAQMDKDKTTPTAPSSSSTNTSHPTRRRSTKKLAAHINKPQVSELLHQNHTAEKSNQQQGPLQSTLVVELSRICAGLNLSPPDFGFLKTPQSSIGPSFPLPPHVFSNVQQMRPAVPSGPIPTIFGQHPRNLMMHPNPHAFGPICWGAPIQIQGPPFYKGPFSGNRLPTQAIPVGTHNQFVPLQVTKKRVSNKKNYETKESAASEYVKHQRTEHADKIEDLNSVVQTVCTPSVPTATPQASIDNQDLRDSKAPFTPRQTRNHTTPSSSGRRKPRKLAVNFDAAKVTEQ
ncbi:ATR kinase, partial [Polypterus senegalus]